MPEPTMLSPDTMIGAHITFKHPDWQKVMTGEILAYRDYAGKLNPAGTYLHVRYQFASTGAVSTRWVHEDNLLSYIRPSFSPVVEKAIAA